MPDRVIENPILNSPYREPSRHFVFDDDGITNEIAEDRRRSAYFIPIPRPRKHGARQLELATEWTRDRIRENHEINEIRAKVGLWRRRGYPDVTPTTRALLEYWNDPERGNPILFCQREDDVDFDLVPEPLIDALASYKRLLHRHRYFDYAEILDATVTLLESDDGDRTATSLLEHMRDNVRYVVVDEYQDVNPIQERLVRALCRFGANICVVGDDDQTIYQWRGSEVGNILTFGDRYPDVHRVTLADNFRSSTGIVQIGQAVAELNDVRLTKAMGAAGHQTYERGDILALQFDDPGAEAAWICDRIQRLRGTPFQDEPDAEPRGLAWSDCAVLFRSVAHDADALVDELRRQRIPYVIKGLTRLFDAPEVQAAVACLRYVNGEATGDEVVTAWMAADLGLTQADLNRGLAVLDRARDWSPGERWGAYNIQRAYLDFLEQLRLREERVPSAPGSSRGELVFFNLGKFSQAISDFEQIHFSSDPAQKYATFSGWLTHQAPDYYADSGEDPGYASPDAVTISTVHQAKGMQWPAVFVPAVRHNRFPSKRQGGVNVFHVLPQGAVRDPERYRGLVEDERRLFYVAVTRAQKYLALTHSPANSSQYGTRSEFFNFATRQPPVLTREPSRAPTTLPPRPRRETPEVMLSFSELKYLFECPYQFKLRFLYGFNPPLHEALGYGKSIHDALAEMHKRAIKGDYVTDAEVEGLVDRHLHAPFAYPDLRQQLRRAALDAVHRYLRENADALPRTLYSEQQVRVHVAPGVTVDGRIDLIKKLDTDETSIVDFKSTERAQAEDVTRDQVHVYALGYQELTGESADLIEILNLDKKADSVREMVDDALLGDIRQKIRSAGDALRDNDLPRHVNWCHACDHCDLAGLCRESPVPGTAVRGGS
ncbi:MAG TPA: ATP-dependent DNA helicase [Actinomycetes bacterium]|jgi:DNA helicase-2/ATP-dependent DNA helicase PcrA|nr:ATP-dependent DNA helicase [Actinomycetes bacterium]